MKNSQEEATRHVHEVMDDFECVLCMKLYYRPVTTPCGHTFCKGCLVRSLDHKTSCPMCREALHFSADPQINVTLQNIIMKSFAEEHAKREAEEQRLSVQSEANMPLFVLNTMAVPGQSLPLHVFEPRYRLMMRRCMAGNKIFGMIGAHKNEHGEWVMDMYGTVLKITEFRLLPDGRSYVGTVGTQRFKVLETWVTDGYNAGRVEYIHDVPKDQRQIAREAELLAEITNILRQIANHPDALDGALRQLSQFVGINLQKMPSNHDEASWWLLAILPHDTSSTEALLGSRSTFDRLLLTNDLLREITSGNIRIVAR